MADRRESGCLGVRLDQVRVQLCAFLSIAVLMSSFVLAAPALCVSSGDPAGESAKIPYVGLVLGPVSRSLQIGHGLTSLDPGAEVLGVDPESPAADARVLIGDVILYAGDEPIRSQQDLHDALIDLGESTYVRIMISRDGERKETCLAIVDLPAGYLGFGVVPVCECDSIRKLLPEELAELDSLPVVSWVHPDMTKFDKAKLDTGTVILALDDHETQTVAKLETQAGSVHIGDVVSVKFFSEDKYRHVRFVAQGPPRPWSGLRLEEMSPLLVEAESLSVVPDEAGGLFVRKVESESPAEHAGIRQRDRILSVGGIDLSSTEEFDQRYADLNAGDSIRIEVQREDGLSDTLLLRRSTRIDYTREIPRRPSRFFKGPLPTSIGGIIDVDWMPVFLLPSWTKITGPAWSGAAELRLSEGLPEAGVFCGYGYGSDDERWHYSLLAYHGKTWLPMILYVNSAVQMYHDKISNPIDANIRSFLLGEDLLDYVGEESWRFRWQFTSRYEPAHQALFDLHFARHEAVPTVSRPSWISGRQRFEPNPVEGVAEGRINVGRLRYTYSNADWRNWTRKLADAELLAAGGPLGGDYQFVRCEVDLVSSLRLSERLFFDGRLNAGAGGGDLPLQYEFYAGGPGTLPGHENREFSGDRTVLAQTQLSYVPFVNPEKPGQLRVYMGLNAGHAWEAGGESWFPDLHSDISIGLGYFWQDNRFFFPYGFSFAGSTPIGGEHGKWRFHLSLIGMAIREIAL
jgi:S1-C subfamily serine protease